MFAALVALTAPAAAAYPERNITVICASGAGGIVDVTTRIITDHMSRTLGRTLVVQNEPGAGSTLAIIATAKAAPDGYTVLTIGPGAGVAAGFWASAAAVTSNRAIGFSSSPSRRWPESQSSRPSADPSPERQRAPA